MIYTKAYNDGYAHEKSKAKHSNPDYIKRAIKDCEAMGWRYLQDYFCGKLAALEATRA